MKRFLCCVLFLSSILSCRKDSVNDETLHEDITGSWSLVKTAYYEKGKLVESNEYNSSKPFVVSFQSNGTCFIKKFEDEIGKWNISFKVLYLYPPVEGFSAMEDDDAFDFWYGDYRVGCYKIQSLDGRNMVLKNCFAVFPSEWDSAEDYTLKYFKRQ